MPLLFLTNFSHSNSVLPRFPWCSIFLFTLILASQIPFAWLTTAIYFVQITPNNLTVSRVHTPISAVYYQIMSYLFIPKMSFSGYLSYTSQILHSPACILCFCYIIIAQVSHPYISIGCILFCRHLILLYWTTFFAYEITAHCKVCRLIFHIHFIKYNVDLIKHQIVTYKFNLVLYFFTKVHVAWMCIKCASAERTCA